jgi:hypothetical protein
MTRPSPFKPDGRPPAERRADCAERAFALSSVDTRDWSHPHLPWRLRFRGPDEPGRLADAWTWARAAGEGLARHCRGPVAHASNGLYLAEDADVRRLLELYGRDLTVLQHRSQYDAARAVGARLATPDPAEQPDRVAGRDGAA